MTIYFILTIFTTWENKNVPIFPTMYYCIDRGFLVRVEELFLIYHNNKCKNPVNCSPKNKVKRSIYTVNGLCGCHRSKPLSSVLMCTPSLICFHKCSY